VSESGEFDLLASSLRADASDLGVFVEVLASKLELSFPESVRVERKGGGLLGGEKRVRRLEVEIDDHRYELEADRGRVDCRRRTVVRGIALKNEELTLDEWIEALSRGLAAAAAETEQGRVALQRMLEG
jgi:hypothetical protein